MEIARALFTTIMLVITCHAMADKPLRIATALVEPWGYWQEEGQPEFEEHRVGFQSTSSTKASWKVGKLIFPVREGLGRAQKCGK